MFYAYTGGRCDTVSSFATRGKKLSWQTWNAFDDVTATFRILGDTPGQIDDEKAMAMLEHFTVLLYDRTSDMDNIDELHQQLFTKWGTSMENLPPTKAALVQYAKRAVYQAGHIWGQVFISHSCPSVSRRLGLDRSTRMETCGLPFLRLAYPLESCYAVGAKKAAEVIASATRLP